MQAPAQGQAQGGQQWNKSYGGPFADLPTQELKTQFGRYDKDGSGKITVEELQGYGSVQAVVPLDRLKDIIIVYGQKLHSADIEATLLSHRLSAELLAACAFSIETAKGDQLVVVCEMDRKRFLRGLAMISEVTHIFAMHQA